MTRKSAIVVYVSLILLPSILFAQPGWKLNPDSTNIALLILDYQTYNFEKGHIQKYQPCGNCDSGNLPFNIFEVPPLDFGSIEFSYSETSEIIFAGGVVWAGRGEITYPEEFTPADSFDVNLNNVIDPLSIEYFNRQKVITDSIFKIQADSAWESIKNIKFVEDISQNEYRIGIYLYTPSIGVFNPEPARWVIFLYQGKLSPSSIVEEPVSQQIILFQNYPNPFNPSTTISYSIPFDQDQFVSLQVFDILGNKIQTLVNETKAPGNYKLNFNSENLSSGVYYYTLKAGLHKETRKMLLLK